MVLVSSIILRIAGILSAAYLIQLYWVKCLGGLYLIYLAFNHIFFKQKAHSGFIKKQNFWAIVAIIEITDFIFAVDSILAGLALIGGSVQSDAFPPKIWIVCLGGISGLILIRFAVKLFNHWIDRYPRLELGAHLMIGWIGLKLILEMILKELPNWANLLFWFGMILFFAYGFFTKKRL